MAGAGYKLFNTGDVLTAAQVNTYLMEQTVMVFDDAAARTTALSGVVSEGMISYLKDTNAVEVYNGSAWVASDDPNAIQNTIVDAKGDLIAASANDTPARLAVGANGETLVADSSASVGLRYQEPKAQSPIVNSSFQVWQRGTSFSVSGFNAYTADRWMFASGNNAGRTVSRQTTSDTTNLPNIQYCARVQRNSGNTVASTEYLGYNLETIDSIPFAGKTVTLSFYARRGANFSASSNLLKIVLATGTGTDQNILTSGFTGVASPVNTTATLTTTWQRFSFTATLATNLTQIGLYFAYDSTGTAGAADFFEVTGVQLEVGSVATPFKTYAATLAGELAACQRYYWRNTSDSAYGLLAGAGSIYSTTSAQIAVQFPVPMRIAPSSVEFSTVIVQDSASNNFSPSSAAIDAATSTKYGAGFSLVISGATANRPARLLANNSTSAYIGVSAEL